MDGYIINLLFYFAGLINGMLFVAIISIWLKNKFDAVEKKMMDNLTNFLGGVKDNGPIGEKLN